jgi:hypothetical protein
MKIFEEAFLSEVEHLVKVWAVWKLFALKIL